MEGNMRPNESPQAASRERQILAVLWRNGGATVNALTRFADRGTIYKTMKSLVERGAVQRISHGTARTSPKTFFIHPKYIRVYAHGRNFDKAEILTHQGRVSSFAASHNINPRTMTPIISHSSRKRQERKKITPIKRR